MQYAKHVTTKTNKNTSVKIKAATEQVLNNTGGFVFQVDDWARLNRFLVLGSEGGTYYVGEKKLTKENAACVLRCLESDPARTIKTIVEISDGGRAPKNDPAIFALAMASKLAKSPETRAMAYSVLPKVCRTGTHILQYISAVRELGGFGSGFMRAITRWYMDRPAKQFAYQVAKYQNRNGENHKTALRLAHPGVHHELDASQKEVMHWVMKGWDSVGEVPHPNSDLQMIWAFERAKQMKTKSDVKELVKLIDTYQLPHECIPSEMRNYPEVWAAMLPAMGPTALIRNLGKMTEIGLIKPMSAAQKMAKAKLTDLEVLKKGRVHPLQVLVALKTYSSGHGVKGSLVWTPDQGVVQALDDAFYLSFGAVEPTGKNTLLALDVSGSMTSDSIAGMPIRPYEATAAMSMVTAAVEQNHHIMGFADTFRDLKIRPGMSLSDAMEKCHNNAFGATDCSLPMQWAAKNKVAVDTFCVYTDNETNTGRHASKEIENYRQKTGIPAKLVVIATSATKFSIANPDDAGMMDICGFDTSTPQIISDFSRS
jgi:60 kDa SS-A/Ro ribonucleoprotein